MTTRFLLVRHATCAQMDEYLFGRLVDPLLDARGERQARATAARLAHEPAWMVASSPRRRTRQTAMAIAARSNAPLITAPDLDEIDFGHWSGQPFAALEHDSSWRAWNERRDRACTPAGDSIMRVQSRMARQLMRMQTDFSDRALALVTHAEVIRSTLLWVLGLPASAYVRFEISPSSLSTLVWRDGAFAIHGINECPHETRGIGAADSSAQAACATLPRTR